jgi:N-acetylmuramoyl-L-alanine amidase
MKFINKYKSSNFNFRKKPFKIEYIIIHYTAMRTYQEAIDHLCSAKSKVSAHFLISKLGNIFNLVNIKFRAWHAGNSNWNANHDINSNSIGVEIDNSGHHINFENYTLKQIQSLIKLLIYLKKKYKIKSNNILCHSDIAPYRKIDPGEKFPWNKLFKKNIVFFPKKLNAKDSQIIESYLKIKSHRTIKNRTLFMLEKIGYDTQLARSNAKKLKMLIKAYQMHYRKNLISGNLDKETYEIIKGHFNQLLTV